MKSCTSQGYTFEDIKLGMKPGARYNKEGGGWSTVWISGWLEIASRVRIKKPRL